MIFVLRAIMVSLAFFALIYSFLSLLVVLAWRALRGHNCQKHLPADGLFTLRVIPFATSAAIALFLTLPSFLLFEGRSLDEDLGTFVLSACAMWIIGAGTYRVLSAEARTRRVVSAWLERAVALECDAASPAIILAQTIPPDDAGWRSGAANSDFRISLRSVE